MSVSRYSDAQTNSIASRLKAHPVLPFDVSGRGDLYGSTETGYTPFRGKMPENGTKWNETSNIIINTCLSGNLYLNSYGGRGVRLMCVCLCLLAYRAFSF